ncbi:MAG TPA: isoamylase early set domain-containing protein [Nitrospira sp.]
MDDQEILIQRFLDHDLTPEERVQFLEMVDADPGLRRQWLNFEMLVAEAARLPRIAPSRRFTAQVLSRLDATPKAWWRQLADLATAPRILEWNVAGAMATASVVLIALVGLMRVTPERVGEVPVHTVERQAQPIATASGQETAVYVRLVLLQPDAHSVAVAGDFNGWNPGETKMDRSDGGMWTATIQLKPGRYQYMFVIDGKEWIADPLADEAARDGFGSQNAVLDVTTL